jgi:fucose 4-O-acetylase-like acetyltransferase
MLPSVTLGILSVWLSPLWKVGADWDWGINVLKSLVYGGNWFLTTLFIGKVILWFQLKYLKGKVIWVTALILFSIGVILNLFGFHHNFWWIRQDLLLEIFLVLGYNMRIHNWLCSNKFCAFSLIVFALSIGSAFYLFDDVPGVTMGIFMPNLLAAVFILLLGVSGSISVIYLCKLVGQSKIMEIVGKNSLIIYMLHIPIIFGLTNTFLPILKANVFQSSCLVIICILIFIVVVCSIIAWILNSKYLKWMTGKF